MSVSYFPLSFKTASALSFLALCPLGSVAASVVVHWGGNMTSSTVGSTFNSPAPETFSGGVRKWIRDVDGEALSPKNAVYTGPLFWGVLQTSTTGGATYDFNTARITDNSAGDYFQIWGVTPAGTDIGKVSGVIVFKPDVPGDSIVSFSSTSSLSLNITTFNYSSAMARMVVLSDGKWYVSQGAISGAGALNISNAGDALWAELADPFSTTAVLPALPPSYAIAGSTFEHIEAVGLYFSIQGRASNRDARFSFDSFTVNADVQQIPEPSVALLAIAGVGGLLVLARQRSVG